MLLAHRNEHIPLNDKPDSSIPTLLGKCFVNVMSQSLHAEQQDLQIPNHDNGKSIISMPLPLARIKS